MKGRGKYNPEANDLLRKYAAANGVQIAAAKLARMRNGNAWQKFIQDMAEAATEPPEPPADEAPSAEDEKAMEQPAKALVVTDPQRVMKATWGMWQRAYLRWKEATDDGVAPVDIKTLKELIGTCIKLSQDYTRVKEVCDGDDERARKFIPIEEVMRLRTEFFLPIRDALRNMPFECGPLANPSNHEAGRQGCLEWLDSRMAPVIERAIVKLSEDFSPK
jgi:hypothetical protein